MSRAWLPPARGPRLAPRGNGAKTRPVSGGGSRSLALLSPCPVCSDPNTQPVSGALALDGADGIPPQAMDVHVLRAKARRGSWWTLFGYGGSQFLRLLNNLILWQLLYPEAFGLMAIVSVCLTGLAVSWRPRPAGRSGWV